ncbi:hypothetical protein OHD50_03220 [Escherichia coli]|nr:hypothetical protein [Escherichia coli]
MNLTLPVENYAVALSGVPATAQVTPSPAVAVSADQLPLIVLEITITPLDADASVLISTGIDATQTNHGRQHLDETQVRVFGRHLIRDLHHPGWTQ